MTTAAPVKPGPAAQGHSLGNTAGELVSAGVQLIQIRTEKQLMVAQQRARDEDRFQVKLLAEAAEAGEDFFYSIPYKDHVDGCQDRRRCSCPKTFVEGAGVGLARSAARLWGNCSVETTIEQDLPDAWLVGAWFVDFETNFTKHETKRVSKMKPMRGGRMAVASGKDLDVVYQQGASKVERDVILRALPRHVMERAFETAKQAALMDKMPVKDQIGRLVRRFGEIDVRLSMIEKYLGHPFTEEAIKKAEKDAREVCAHLRGVITAIRGGELEVAEVFGEGGAPTAAPPASNSGSGAVSLDDLEGDKMPPATGVSDVGPAVPQASAKPADPRADHVVWADFVTLARKVEKSYGGERRILKEAPKKGSGQWYLTDPEIGEPSTRLYDDIGKKLTVPPEQLAQYAAKLEEVLT